MRMNAQHATPTLATAMDAFEQWRDSGLHKRQTPEHLQQQVASLVGSHPNGVLCRSLNISNSALKQWVHRWQSEGAGACTADFVALPVESPVEQNCVTELDDQNNHNEVHITLPNGVVLNTFVSMGQLVALIQSASFGEPLATEQAL